MMTSPRSPRVILSENSDENSDDEQEVAAHDEIEDEVEEEKRHQREMEAFAIVEVMKMQMPWFAEEWERRHGTLDDLGEKRRQTGNANEILMEGEKGRIFRSVAKALSSLQERDGVDVVGNYGVLFVDRSRISSLIERRADVEKNVLRTLQSATMVATRIGRQNQFPSLPTDSKKKVEEINPSILFKSTQGLRALLGEMVTSFFQDLLIHDLVPPQLDSQFTAMKEEIQGHQNRKGEPDPYIAKHYASLGPSSTLFLSMKYRIEESMERILLLGGGLISLLHHFENEEEASYTPEPPNLRSSWDAVIEEEEGGSGKRRSLTHPLNSPSPTNISSPPSSPPSSPISPNSTSAPNLPIPVPQRPLRPFIPISPGERTIGSPASSPSITPSSSLEFKSGTVRSPREKAYPSILPPQSTSFSSSRSPIPGIPPPTTPRTIPTTTTTTAPRPKSARQASHSLSPREPPPQVPPRESPRNSQPDFASHHKSQALSQPNQPTNKKRQFAKTLTSPPNSANRSKSPFLLPSLLPIQTPPPKENLAPSSPSTPSSPSSPSKSEAVENAIFSRKRTPSESSPTLSAATSNHLPSLPAEAPRVSPRVPGGKKAPLLDLNMSTVLFLKLVGELMGVVTSLLDHIATFRGLSFRHTGMVSKAVVDVIRKKEDLLVLDVDIWETFQMMEEAKKKLESSEEGGKKAEKEKKKEEKEMVKTKKEVQKAMEKEEKMERKLRRNQSTSSARGEENVQGITDSNSDPLNVLVEAKKESSCESANDVTSTTGDVTTPRYDEIIFEMFNSPRNNTGFPLAGSGSPPPFSSSSTSTSTTSMKRSVDEYGDISISGSPAKDSDESSEKKRKKKRSNLWKPEDLNLGSSAEGEGEEKEEREEKKRGEKEFEQYVCSEPIFEKDVIERGGNEKKEKKKEKEKKGKEETTDAPFPGIRLREEEDILKEQKGKEEQPQFRRSLTAKELIKKSSKTKFQDNSTEFSVGEIPKKKGKKERGGDPKDSPAFPMYEKKEKERGVKTKRVASMKNVPSLNLKSSNSSDDFADLHGRTILDKEEKKGRKISGFVTFRKKAASEKKDIANLWEPSLVANDVTSSSAVLRIENMSVETFRIKIRYLGRVEEKRKEDKHHKKVKGGEEILHPFKWMWYNREEKKLCESCMITTLSSSSSFPSSPLSSTPSCPSSIKQDPAFVFPGNRELAPLSNLSPCSVYEVLVVGKTGRGESVHSPTVTVKTLSLPEVNFESKSSERRERSSGSKIKPNPENANSQTGPGIGRRKSVKNLKNFGKVEKKKKNQGSGDLNQITSVLQKVEDDFERVGMSTQKGKISALNQLVIALTAPESHDLNFVRVFFVCFSSFTTADKLLETLIQRYHVPSGLLPQQTTDAIQIRVGAAIKHWLVTQFNDFTSLMISELHEFIDELKSSENRSMLGEALMALLGFLFYFLKERKREKRKTSVKKIEEKQKRILEYPPVPHTLSQKISHSPLFLLKFGGREIARQLTLLDYEVFREIEASELLELRWSRASQKHLAHHVCASLNRLNSLSLFVPTTILCLPSHRLRVSMLEKWIDITIHLRGLNSFQSLMGVFVGLNLSSCQRMKKLWNSISPSKKFYLKEIEEFLSPNNSFRNYRNFLHSALLPICPYLGLYLSDLTAIDSGNPDRIGEEVNFVKQELIYRVIDKVRGYQATPFPIDPIEPLYSSLSSFCPLSETQLYAVSLWREKKEEKREGERREEKREWEKKEKELKEKRERELKEKREWSERKEREQKEKKK